MPVTSRSIPLAAPGLTVKVVPPGWLRVISWALITEVLETPPAVTLLSRFHVPQSAALPVATAGPPNVPPAKVRTPPRWSVNPLGRVSQAARLDGDWHSGAPPKPASE